MDTLCAHKIERGVFFGETDIYFFRYKCSKCDKLFGLPRLTDRRFKFDYINNLIIMEILTKREIQIAELRTFGLMPNQIGERLNISENTVNNHLQNIFRKANVNNAISFTRWFIYKFEVSKIARMLVVIFLSLQFAIVSANIDMRRSGRRGLRRTSRRQYVVLKKNVVACSVAGAIT